MTKVVINNDGGGAVVGDFPLFVDGSPVTSGVEIAVNAGVHNVRETNLPGYAGTISGNCAPNGDIVLNVGDVASCTITNNDIAPRLTVTKVVINNDSGTATLPDFKLLVDTEVVNSGVTNNFPAGPHIVSETNPPGYSGAISGDCAADGSITLALAQNATCTITNDDLPALSINDIFLTEGNSGTAFAIFFVTLSQPSPVLISVQYSTVDGTATAGPVEAGGDYLSSSGTITFLPNTTTQGIVILVNGDTSVESDETFFVNLVSAVDATIADGQGQGTIVDDDIIG